MPNTRPTPILNASLPKQFRQVRIALAREPGHPEGDADVAYIIVAPLDSEDRFDAGIWREHRDACRVSKEGALDEIGDEAGAFTGSAGRRLGLSLRR